MGNTQCHMNTRGSCIPCPESEKKSLARNEDIYVVERGSKSSEDGGVR